MVKHNHSVSLFIGQDSYLIDDAVKKISAAMLDKSSIEFDYKLLYGAETDAAEILSYANTAPFASSKRVVVVKDFEKLSSDDKSRIVSYARTPFESTCLILESREDSVLKECADLARFADIRKTGNLTEEEFASWVRQLLSVTGKDIEEAAIDDLKELHGQNLWSLSQELDKLATFLGDRKTVTSEDIDGLVGRSVESSSFDLGWAVSRKDRGESMRIASELLISGRRHHEIIGVLCWHLKMLLKAKSMQSSGHSDYAISGMMGVRKKYSDELCAEARRVSLEQLKSSVKILLEADLDMKLARLDPDLVLEFAIVRLCLI